MATFNDHNVPDDARRARTRGPWEAKLALRVPELTKRRATPRRAYGPGPIIMRALPGVRDRRIGSRSNDELDLCLADRRGSRGDLHPGL